MQVRRRDEREARLAEYERLMQEQQENKERAKEERRAQQQIKKREYQRKYDQNHVKTQLECERCKKIYSTVYSMRRDTCFIINDVRVCIDNFGK